MPRYLKIGHVDPAVISSTHAMSAPELSTADTYDSGYIRIGRAPRSGDIPNTGVSQRVRDMFRVRSMRPSRAVARRNTGDPKWFMSSAAPPTGALFIDTDGLRIQDGDDF